MSVVNIARESVSRFYAGNGTVGETPAQLSGEYEVLKHVVVQANSGNGGTITVGVNEALAAEGYILEAGESTPPIYIDFLNKVWVVGSEADQDYNWIAT